MLNHTVITGSFKQDVEGLARILLRLEKASHLPTPNYRERKSNTAYWGRQKTLCPVLKLVSTACLKQTLYSLAQLDSRLTREHLNVSPHPVVLKKNNVV